MASSQTWTNNWSTGTPGVAWVGLFELRGLGHIYSYI